MVQQLTLDGWERLIDPIFNNKSVRTGTDQELFSLQAVFISTVLDKALLNTYGIKLVRLYKDSPRVIQEKHQEH